MYKLVENVDNSVSSKAGFSYSIMRPDSSLMVGVHGERARYMLKTARGIVNELNYALELGTKDKEDNLFSQLVGKRRGNETLFEALFGK